MPIKFLIPLLLAVAAVAHSASASVTVQELIDRVRYREKVLNGARNFAFHVVLPATYSRCLHAAVVEAGRSNGVANDFALAHIDLLDSEQVSAEAVESFIAFGHGLNFAAFAAARGKSPGEVVAADLEQYSRFLATTYAALACETHYGDPEAQLPLRRLIRIASGMPQERSADEENASRD
jgi:hypothetical protein